MVESHAVGTVMTRPQSSVIINGAPAISGTTIFPGDVLLQPLPYRQPDRLVLLAESNAAAVRLAARIIRRGNAGAL